MARTEIVEFKVDAEEKQRLRAFAQERGEPLGTYVRKAALAFPEYGKTPIHYETQHDRENKAKVREAVANEEPYEVKVKPGSVRKDYEEIEQPESFKAAAEDPRPKSRQQEKAAETWIVRRTNELALRMPKRRALAQATMEWGKRNP